MRKFAAFDIGGTDIKHGIVLEDGDIIERSSMATRASEGKSQLLRRVAEQVELYKRNHSLAGIAISSAGVVNVDEGKIMHTTNVIKDYDNTPVKTMLEESTGLKTEINNDVNCFALCEARIGAAADVSDALVMTVGTGIGGGILINNELIYGAKYAAGEWGHMEIPGGMYETVASVSALVKDARHQMGPHIKNGLDVFNAYDGGDMVAKECVEKFYTNLAIGIANLISIFNPGRIVIGGGISERATFIDELTRHLEKHAKKEFFESVSLKSARFNNLSGMKGAMFHFLEMEQKRQ